MAEARAIWQGMSLGSNCVIRRIPERPCSSPSQYWSRVAPSGDTAPNPVMTTLRYFRNEYVEHVVNKYCPALVCRSLIEYYVIPNKCTGCQRCVSVCPTGAISGPRSEPHNLDTAKCIKCRACLEICRFDAIAGNAIAIRTREER